MADENNMDPNDLKQMKALMGDKKNAFVKVDKMQPPEPKAPKKRPQQKEEAAAIPAGKGTPPVYPIFTPEELKKRTAEVPQTERTFNDVFAGNKSDKFDPELNEYALKTVAEERGITVEELLNSKPDVKLEKKVEPMDQVLETAPAEPSTENQILDLELEELELKRRELELRKKKAGAPQAAPVAPAAPAVPTKTAEEFKHTRVADNPVLRKMRQRLSMEAKDTAKVTIMELEFELNEPPTSLHPWVYQKLAAAQSFGNENLFIMTLQNATISAAILRIDGQPVAEVLGLAEPGTIKDPYAMPMELKELVAQTLWEMIAGVNSLEGMFTFDSDVVQALYRSYQGKFRNKTIVTSLDKELHRYVCPVPDCTEIHDMKPNKDGEAFCRIHGVKMTDQGLTAELRAIPLV